jgi:hypothetical protein
MGFSFSDSPLERHSGVKIKRNCSGQKTKRLKTNPVYPFDSSSLAQGVPATMDPTHQPSAEGVNEFPMSPNVEEIKTSLKHCVH